MRVFLLHPEESRNKYNFEGIIENECLDLEYLSAVLKENGHETAFWDGKIEKRREKDVLENYNPDVLYITGRDFQEKFMLGYAESAKKFNPNMLVIMGGLHAQLCFERMYKDYTDIVLKSFDVFKVPPILEAKAKYLDSENPDKEGFLKALESIEDISFKSGDKWISNVVKPFDINRLPRPDRSYFDEHPDRYNYLDLPHASWVRTAYSCPYRCAFCMRNKMNMSTYSRRDIVDVVDEIEGINSDQIYIVDDDFLFDEERLKTFIRLIKEKNIKKRYICYGRSDFIAAHEDLVKEMAEIGFYYFLVGLETIRYADMTKYNKKNSLDHNEKSIELCHKYGVHMMGMFILDLDFTRKDFKDLYKWIKAHELKHVAVSIFTPEMGLETSDQYKDRMITDDPSDYDYLHLVCKPDKLSVKAYYRSYYKLLIKLFLKAKKDGVYDFLDYKAYIKDFVTNIFSGRAKYE